MATKTKSQELEFRSIGVHLAVRKAFSFFIPTGQRSLVDAELISAQARNHEYQSLVQLDKALGGG